jgi:hypothetical protein
MTTVGLAEVPNSQNFQKANGLRKSTVLEFPSNRLGDLLTEKSSDLLTSGLLTFLTKNADRIIFNNVTSHGLV